MTLFVNYWTLSSFAILIITTPYWWYMPSWVWSVPCLVWLLLCYKFRWLRWGCGLIAALLIVIVSGGLIHHQTNTLFSAGSNLIINAKVDSLFTPITYGFRGIAVVRSINGNKIDYFSRPKIYLTSPVPLELGSMVTASVTVKPIVGILNQVGFDKEKWALSQHVVGQAKIGLNASMIVRSQINWRQFLFSNALNQAQEFTHRGLLLALGFGERNYIDHQQRQRLQFSGLNHLIAISGLHIGIAFGFGWMLGWQLVRLGFKVAWLPALLAVGVAIMYAWLAGFSLPTQRALILILVFVVLRLLSIHTSYRYKWLLMVAALLFYDPFAVYSLSFWMSIYAVAVVFFALSVINARQPRWRTALTVQTLLVMLISPVVALLFHGVGLAALIYNLLFVPWFSLVIIPLVLASMLFGLMIPPLSVLLLSIADLALYPITFATQFSERLWWPISDSYGFILVVFAICLLLLPLIKRQWVLGMCIAALLLGIRRDSDDWRLTLLDVGHGLAIVIESQGQAMLYDTGSGWESSSYAEWVIIPYLQTRGLNLDTIIVSHFDNDHAGGVTALIERYPLVNILASQQQLKPAKLIQTVINQKPCIAGERWQWQGLELQVLWPHKLVNRAYNPHSCVIKITDSMQRRVLLTGDIDAVAEWLLLRDSQQLASEVIIVPHHGSRSSSRSEFVVSVGANYALSSNAYQGRWQLPNIKVKQRYLDSGSRWFDTGSHGQIDLSFNQQNITVETMRTSKGRAWYRQMLRKRVE